MLKMIEKLLKNFKKTSKTLDRANSVHNGAKKPILDQNCLK